jgi:NAD(P)-dependent dehydrogenase (short-subunit alcohol dehydrogenase family)
MSSERNDVVVVTGASAGLGRATALAFARRGSDVALLARGREGLDAARREIEALGRRALAIRVDVANDKEVESAADQTERMLGPIDIWVNNAMVSVFSPFAEMTLDEFRRVTEVTYLGTVYGTMAALRRMLPRDRGCIVQVGSALAYRAIPLQSAYCGAKHGVQGFTESLRTELLHDGKNIRLTMVQLPALNTPQFRWVKSRLPRKPQPVPPIYQPEVAAEAIVWASYHYRREMRVAFPTILATLADKFAPAIADEYLAREGYDAQQTEEPVEKKRKDNLLQPLPGDAGAHGDFDDRARSSSAQLWASTDGIDLTLAGGLLAGIILGALWRRS